MQETSNGIPERFPVRRAYILDGSPLFEVGPVGSDRFPQAANRKYFSATVPGVVDVFFRWVEAV